jgi:hypothetical protein
LKVADQASGKKCEYREPRSLPDDVETAVKLLFLFFDVRIGSFRHCYSRDHAFKK